ncbi:hypothetical protein [Halolamina sp.]|jgi:ABC-type multidrug transport system permease subunit|uniref:hypothetical protein n=1 Tax=Halolamina sp. TaxID=1940283 RepID=UPI000223BD2B|nr:hypothetical protein Halar_3153 [halophilic archaeon DL31]
MRLPTKALLVGLVLLAVSHFFAITTESQIAAQLSWLLIFAVIILALVALVSRYSTGSDV